MHMHLNTHIPARLCLLIMTSSAAKILSSHKLKIHIFVHSNTNLHLNTLTHTIKKTHTHTHTPAISELFNCRYLGLNDELHLPFNRDMIERDFLTATFAINKRGLN